MARRLKNGNTDLVKEYRMLEKMSRDIGAQQKGLQKVSKRLAKSMKTEFKAGILENLDIVATYMRNAKRELDKARKELGLI